MRGDLLGVRAALPLFFTVTVSQEPCLFWGRHGRQGKVQMGLRCPLPDVCAPTLDPSEAPVGLQLGCPLAPVFVACVALIGEFVGVVDLGQGIASPGPMSTVLPCLWGSSWSVLSPGSRGGPAPALGLPLGPLCTAGGTSLGLRPWGRGERRASYFWLV